MGCVKLHLLNQQYKNTELKVSYLNKELTLKNSAVKERRAILVRYVDPDGRDAKDRIAVAIHMLGTPYKQETSHELRTSNSEEALAYMDCSEFTSRVMVSDGILDKNTTKTSSQITDMAQQNRGEDFEVSITPQEGDIFTWDGHCGIVESYDLGNEKVTVLHATRYKKKDGTKVSSAVRETYSLKYYKNKGTTFFHPKNETTHNSLKQAWKEFKNSIGELISTIRELKTSKHQINEEIQP